MTKLFDMELGIYKTIEFYDDYLCNTQQTIAKLSIYDIEFTLKSDFKNEKYHFTIQIEDLSTVQLVYLKNYLIKSECQGIRFI